MKFTKIAVSVLAFIFVALITFYFIKFSDKVVTAQVKETQIVIRDAADQVNAFFDVCGRFPTTEEGFGLITSTVPACPHWKGRKLLTKDAWDHELHYVYPGSGDMFDIISYGADGKVGGDGYDADISWTH